MNRLDQFVIGVAVGVTVLIITLTALRLLTRFGIAQFW